VSLSGRKVMDDWRRGLQIGPRVALDTFLKNMAKRAEWGSPEKGLTELRWVSGNVQHRVIGYGSGDHEYTMLIGCTHKDKRYSPTNALSTAVDRRSHLQRGDAQTDEYELPTDR
jgi:hypothetical protein